MGHCRSMTVPPLLKWSGDTAEWENYLDRVYSLFLSLFVHANHLFLGKPVKARWAPSHDNKHFSFWHVISERGETKSEEDRLPNLQRCERIAWLGYVLENAADRSHVWCWRNTRRGTHGVAKNYLLYLHQERYLIVLAEKDDCFLLVTAYPVESNHTHTKLQREKNSSPDPRT